MIDTIPVFVAAYQPDGTRSFVNQTWQHYMGLTLEEATGAGAQTFPHFHPDDHAEVNEAAWRASLASGEPLSIEVRVRRADGQYRWHTSRRVPLRDEKGDIVRWYSVGIDIEDQKLAEDALRRSEARLAKAERELQLMIDTIPAFVTVFGPDGEREYVNKTWRDNTGLQLADIQDGGWMRIVHPDDQERSARLWREAVATGEPLKIEQRIRRHDGQYRWHMGRRIPLHDNSGNILRWYSVAIDIEDQKRAEEALRESEAQLKEAQRELQLTIDSIPVLVAAYRPDGVRTFVNQTWRDYTGLTHQEVTGEAKSGFPHFHPDDAKQIEPAIRASLKSGEPLPYEVRLRGCDGEYRWHSVRRVPLRDESGAIIRWYSTGFDIQDRKRAEEALRQSEARLAEAERELRLTLDLIPTMTWRAARNGYVQSLNKRWYDYTGSTPEQVQNNGWRAFVHPDDLTELTASGLRNIPHGRPIDAEARLRRHDGAYRWFMFRVEPARDESGEIAAWYGTITDLEDRKRAEQAQRESEARRAEAEREARLTLDSIPTITWRAGANGYVQQLNKRWFEYTGTTPEEVRGWRWKLCVHPDDLDRLVEIGTQYVATGIPIDGEARLRRFDGEYRWFLFRPAPVRDDAGNVVAWYGSITDIEDRKQAEGAQRESEARLFEAERELRRTLDSIPTMTWRAAPNGYVEQINKQAYDYTGATPDEMRGHRWQHVVHPDDLPGLIAAGNVNVPAGQPLDHEARLRRFDGEYRWFLFRLAPSRDEIGRIIAWYGSITDIEDRKQAEGALRESESRLAQAERELRRTLDSIPTMTWRAAPNGYVQQINKQFFDYTGTTPDEMQGHRWRTCVHPDDLPGLIAAGNANVSTGTPLDAEARLRRFDGQYRWFLFRLAPSRDETGTVIAWYGSITDIEDRKGAEQALQQSEAQLAKAERELRLTLNSIPTMTWRSAPNGYVQQLNKRFFDYTGTTPEQVQGRGWQSVVHPDDLEPLLDSGRAYVSSGIPDRRRGAGAALRWDLSLVSVSAGAGAR